MICLELVWILKDVKQVSITSLILDENLQDSAMWSLMSYVSN